MKSGKVEQPVTTSHGFRVRLPHHRPPVFNNILVGERQEKSFLHPITGEKINVRWGRSVSKTQFSDRKSDTIGVEEGLVGERGCHDRDVVLKAI